MIFINLIRVVKESLLDNFNYAKGSTCSIPRFVEDYPRYMNDLWRPFVVHYYIPSDVFKFSQIMPFTTQLENMVHDELELQQYDFDYRPASR